MMLGELNAIVAGGESEQVEFKKSTGQRTDAAKAVCAMLNARGGFMLFGVTDAGDMVGQQVTAKTLENVVRELRKIEPSVLLNPEEVTLSDDRSVIVIPVPQLGGGPYTYDGRPYVRQGPTTIIMPQEQYRRLLLEQMHPTQRWESQPAYEFGIEDLDHAEITRTVDEAIRRGRMEEPGTRDPEALLLGLDLIQHGRLLNAAVVLFGKTDRFMPHYPQCLLRMARFRGVTKSEFIDNQQARGHAFQLLIRAQRFMQDHLPIAGRIVPGVFERIDEPLYPPEALREALANALCHRDYGIGGGSIGVAIFDDRLEISSTGPLHFGLTPDDLLKPHASKPWNRLISNVVYRRAIIEQWGRGTLKMVELTRQAGLVPPEFEEQTGEVIVRFRPVGYELSALQEEILNVLAELGPSSIAEIVGSVEGAKRTIQRNLNTLRERGFVRLEGRGHVARWRL